MALHAMTFATMPQSLRKTRLGSLLAGMGALVSIWPPASAPTRYPHRNEGDALRGDAMRIGNDMRRVIESERARIKTSAE